VPWLVILLSKASRDEPGRGLKSHRVFSVDEDEHPLTVLLGCFLHVQKPPKSLVEWPILNQ
jgi:hypothetical protein